MRSIKRALDPYWLMNPGKIFEVTDTIHAHDEVKASAASTLRNPENQGQRVSDQMFKLQ